jgi:hypothetical protein
MAFSTSFQISSYQTVDPNFIWDQGVPVLSSLPLVTTSTAAITGYAPGIQVSFQNKSGIDTSQGNTGAPLIAYNWNFNDYYNVSTNTTSLTGTDTVTHTYIMPGTYYPTLNSVQSTIQGIQNPVNYTKLCFGDYDDNWYWQNFYCTTSPAGAANTNLLQWDSLKSTSQYPKTWDSSDKCLQKYCLSWSWRLLQSNSKGSVTWAQAKRTGPYSKLWRYEPNNTVCAQPIAKAKSVLLVQEQTVQNVCSITVLEKSPVAGMYCFTPPPLTAINQITVQLTPRTTVTGSFPIDRIVWDLGDGTPLITVSRYSTPTDPSLIATNVLSSDPADVRNYDVVHTYYRNSKNTYPVFYPSLTCYSANTNTSDSCCLTIGPITLSSTPSVTHLLKTKNTMSGNMYIFGIDNNISFTTNAVLTASSMLPTSNIPPSTLKSSLSSIVSYTGNPGNIPIV